MKHCFIISTALAFLVGCTGVPTQFTRLETPPTIFPDYTDVVIPSNIAPLNFRIEEKETNTLPSSLPVPVRP